MSIGNSDTGFILAPYDKEPGTWLQGKEQSITYKTASVGDVAEVLKAIPEMHSRNLIQSILDRISNKDYLALVAYSGQKPVGCKLGYAMDEANFYSWLGGVIPEHRGQGIAQPLLNQQEAWATQQGYRHIHVKSMNQYPAMLTMLIKNGYQICGYEDKGSVEESKVCFVKRVVVAE
ncbi:GNAT family N-acetyltransferase [Aliidiomarina minuta]|uniref:GNAT family N-acetyltransferase n=1 Tax=Aliidiomarina minuta TaxID=880057 RepID=A0A432W3L5_9GAMM|nr:GNAT family N-acetyltransferase [Aliidiomarina minuta]RUO23921.1 GNAT family N-acetyltransferase [Aliidiomarina minuta]